MRQKSCELSACLDDSLSRAQGRSDSLDLPVFLRRIGFDEAIDVRCVLRRFERVALSVYRGLLCANRSHAEGGL